MLATQQQQLQDLVGHLVQSNDTMVQSNSTVLQSNSSVMTEIVKPKLNHRASWSDGQSFKHLKAFGGEAKAWE